MTNDIITDKDFPPYHVRMNILTRSYDYFSDFILAPLVDANIEIDMVINRDFSVEILPSFEEINSELGW